MANELFDHLHSLWDLRKIALAGREGADSTNAMARHDTNANVCFA